jgi:hypothetical protein
MVHAVINSFSFVKKNQKSLLLMYRMTRVWQKNYKLQSILLLSFLSIYGNPLKEEDLSAFEHKFI